MPILRLDGDANGEDKATSEVDKGVAEIGQKFVGVDRRMSDRHLASIDAKTKSAPTDTGRQEL